MSELTIYAVQSLPPAELGRLADFVSDFTNGPPGLEAKLLPLTRAEAAARAGFIACEGPEFRGYAGMDWPVPGNPGSELGPFIVPPEYRKRGIGGRLLARVTYAALADGQVPYVFGNDANMGNLARMGFRPDRGSLPLDPAYGLCTAKCPFFDAESACCNTPVVLQGDPQRPDVPVGVWPQGAALQL